MHAAKLTTPMFALGNEVTWKGQDGKVRTGWVHEIVPKGRAPIGKDPKLMARSHEWYVVRVGTSLYYPKVTALALVGTPHASKVLSAPRDRK